MLKRILLNLCIPLVLVSCGSDSKSKSENISILSYKNSCIGMVQYLCSVSKNENTGEPVNIHTWIENFDFIWGHNYQLKVEITHLDNPPADGSSEKWQVKEVISDIEDKVGQKYFIKSIRLFTNTFTIDLETNQYQFLGKEFDCSSDVDCDALVGINDTGGVVDVTFEYAGSGKITLVNWN